MPKAPKNPEEVFDVFVKDLQEDYGSDLVSIILYGSGARGEYIPGKSDINFLVLLTEEGINNLSKAIPIVSKWHKHRVSTPLFLTEAYIKSSLDTFPIEFINIKSAHQVIYGKDVLQDLAFGKNFVRLQCERELKGKLLQLREHFLETEGNRGRIEELINGSLSTFFSLFQAVLFLLDKEPVIDKQTLIASMAEKTGLDQELFLELVAIKEGRKKLASGETLPFMEKYIKEIRKLSAFVDQMNIA